MATKIILLTDVENLGLRGDVVDVASGYARNYLLPRRMAETATPAKVAELERREAHRARHDARTGDQARDLAAKLEALELRFDVNAGPTGTLFGSITPTDIAERIREASAIRVDRRKVHLAEPIKRIGRYEIEIAIFEDVTATVRTLVVPEGGELPPEEPEASARPRRLPKPRRRSPRRARDRGRGAGRGDRAARHARGRARRRDCRRGRRRHHRPDRRGRVGVARSQGAVPAKRGLSRVIARSAIFGSSFG